MNGLMLLLLFTIFISITTLLNIYTKGKHVAFGKLKIQFVIGGFLVFIGKERNPARPKPLGRRTSLFVLSSIFVGMGLFYAVFIPRAIEFIPKVIDYIKGVTTTAPQPIAVPVPLLFKFTEIVPYILMSIAVAVAVHEAMHALVALREGVPVKSWGIGMLLLLPLAFVELDENAFNASQPKSKLAILSAGVFGNALASIIVLLLIGLTTTFIIPTFVGRPMVAVTIYEVDCSICNTSTCPAVIAGLQANMIIHSINHTEVKSSSDLANIISSVPIGSNLTLRVCEASGDTCRSINLTVSAHRQNNPRSSCIGIRFGETTIFMRDSKAFRAPWIENLITALYTIFVINISLFMINSIPLFITDGALLMKYLPIRGKMLRKLISTRVLDVANALIMAVILILSSYLLLLG